MTTGFDDTSGAFHPASAPDFLPRPQLESLQLARLQAVILRSWERVPLFRGRMEERGLAPGDLHVLSDLGRFPFTVKEDLRAAYPFGLFASPMEEIVRLHASSGTTGKPVVVAYTEADLRVWTSVMVRSLAACGLHAGDVVQNAYGYGLFTGGLGVHAGAEALGATVIPISGGNTERQLMVLQDFGVTAICCTPSYMVHLIERAREAKVGFGQLKVGIFGAEPWSEEMRRHIMAESGIRAHDLYGLSEIIGPGVGVECRQLDGLHLFEDHFYPEIIDPESGAVLPEGAEGELVLTTLSKQAMPLIRYRTRDLTAISIGACRCGRTLRRIRRIGRRSDDMLIIRGVNVFPSRVEAALLAVEGTLPHYQIVLTRERALDEMEVQVEVTAAFFSDQLRELARLQAQLADAVEQAIGLRVKVTLVAPRTLARSEGQAQRVVDRRRI
jgi:phenylacetate-CoA ligase